MQKSLIGEAIRRSDELLQRFPSLLDADQGLLDRVIELQTSVATLAELAAWVDVRPELELLTRLERLQQDVRGSLEELRVADPTLAAASAGL